MRLRKPSLKAAIEGAFWIGLLGFVGTRLWPQLEAAVGVGGAGPEVAAFAVATLDGDSVRLSDLRGHVVLVNVWATWCPPCRVEMPGFEKVWRAHRDRGFTVLALSTDRGPHGVVREFVTERGLTFDVAMANREALRALDAGNALPTSYVIDAEGRIRHTVIGIFARPALERAVVRLLDERDAALAAQAAGPAAR